MRNELVQLVRDRISAYQKILYLISKSSNESRITRDPYLLELVKSGDLDGVKRWFKGDLDALSLAGLRDLALREGIYPVYGKSRFILITEINHVRRIRKASEG